MLIASIIVIGAVVGGVVGGTVSHKNNKAIGNGPSATVSVAPAPSMSVDTSIVAPALPTDGPLISTSSTPGPRSSTGAIASLMALAPHGPAVH